MIEEFAIKLDSWQTPATRLIGTEIGKARIFASKYRKGYYSLAGDAKYRYYYLSRPTDVATLRIGSRVWMVDDPQHWWSAQNYAQFLAKSGCKRIACAGFGLGLIGHAINAAYREEGLASPTVVYAEQSQDVAAMLHHHDLGPTHEIHIGDWYEFANIHGPEFDGAYFDLFVGDGNDAMFHKAIEESIVLGAAFPNAKLHLINGFTGSIIPSIAAIAAQRGR